MDSVSREERAYFERGVITVDSGKLEPAIASMVQRGSEQNEIEERRVRGRKKHTMWEKGKAVVVGGSATQSVASKRSSFTVAPGVFSGFQLRQTGRMGRWNICFELQKF